LHYAEWARWCSWDDLHFSKVKKTSRNSELSFFCHIFSYLVKLYGNGNGMTVGEQERLVILGLIQPPGIFVKNTDQVKGIPSKTAQSFCKAATQLLSKYMASRLWFSKKAPGNQ